MKRHEFFQFKRAVAPPTTGLKVSRRTNTGLDVYSSSWNQDDLLHLLRRVTFGVSKGDLEEFNGLNLEKTIDKLLDTSVVSTGEPLNHYGSRFADPDVKLGESWVKAPYNPTLEGVRKQSMKGWIWSLALNQKPTAFGKMLLFWHNHFAVEMRMVPSASAFYHYWKVLSDYSLGNFKTFTRQITIDTAMLYYLNGRLNRKGAPDENYARELQELFTLGKGPDSQYTEDDVKAAARVLTGFTINNSTTPFSSIFSANRHDTDDKQFSAFFNNTVIKGRTGINAGMDELNDMLDMIFAKEEVSKHICRKLYRFFVYYKIDDNAETNVIEPLAKVFRDNNFELKPVLKALLMSEHFFDSWNRACVIKDPLTHSINFFRQFEVKFPSDSNVETLYQAFIFGAGYTAINQMDLGDPPSVAGWEAWYQLPLYQRSWITSDSLPKRNELQDYILWLGHKIGAYTMKVDVWDLTKKFSKPNDADQLIDDAMHFLLPMSLSAGQLSTLKNILLPGGIPDYNWTDDYNAAINDTYPNHATALQSVTLRLSSLYKAMMNLSEYQLS